MCVCVLLVCEARGSYERVPCVLVYFVLADLPTSSAIAARYGEPHYLVRTFSTSVPIAEAYMHQRTSEFGGSFELRQDGHVSRSCSN